MMCPRETPRSLAESSCASEGQRIPFPRPQIWTVKSIEGDRVILHEESKILKRGSFFSYRGREGVSEFTKEECGRFS